MSTKIRLKCETCDRALSVDAEKAGKKLRCPGCQSVITVPSASESAAPTARTPRRNEESEATQPVAKSRPARTVPTDVESESPRPARRAKRSTSHDPDDIWSQPLSSYSSPAIEEHEYEQFGIAPKKTKVVEEEAVPGAMTLKGPMIFFAVGMFVAFVSIGLAFGVPEAGRIVSFVAIGIGALLSIVGHWNIRETAYSESTTCGLMFVWVPFYQPYYIITRFSYVKIPFLVNILGSMVAIMGIVGMVIANIQLEKVSGG